ncbi:hypothetical protein ABFS83_04G127900 [Erythranthe nasuta]
MELVGVLRMNGGLRETSYANNSLVQRKVISMTRPIREEAITELFSSRNSIINGKLCVAELGCSSGPNALLVATEIVKTVEKICRKHGRWLPEFQIQLNDLPGNDFNSIFQSSLPSFQAELLPVLQEVGFGNEYCFVSGVPGSFYSRLFAAKTLHFVHSSYSLMWLSKVPEGLEMNKENIYMSSKSPAHVINAYYEQFRIDFSTFLRCRSEEVVSGGRMVLTILGRKSEDASSKECCYIWELLALSLRQMVSEGVIEKEKLESFNIPQYTPSAEEVRKEVEKEGSFTISRLESSEITWASCGPEPNNNDAGDYLTQCMRSVAEPLLVNHFGKLVIDPLFQIYAKILSQRISDEDAKFFNVTVSLTMRSEQLPSS